MARTMIFIDSGPWPIEYIFDIPILQTDILPELFFRPHANIAAQAYRSKLPPLVRHHGKEICKPFV